MPAKFAVVCEAEADFRTAAGLAELVFLETFDWFRDAIEGCPLWHGIDAESPFLIWKDVRRLAAESNIRAHGHFDGKPAEPDALAARRALLLMKLKHQERPLEGILLIRDDDRDNSRRLGLEQARGESEMIERIVIGLAHTKRECWVLAGFIPEDEGEVAQLAEFRSELGFDPSLSAHELTAKHDHDKRSGKRVLGLLTRGDYDREVRCWQQTSLEILEERGELIGLTAYLNEIRDRLAPLFKRRPANP